MKTRLFQKIKIKKTQKSPPEKLNKRLKYIYKRYKLKIKHTLENKFSGKQKYISLKLGNILL